MARWAAPATRHTPRAMAEAYGAQWRRAASALRRTAVPIHLHAACTALPTRAAHRRVPPRSATNQRAPHTLRAHSTSTRRTARAPRDNAAHAGLMQRRPSARHARATLDPTASAPRASARRTRRTAAEIAMASCPLRCRQAAARATARNLRGSSRCSSTKSRTRCSHSAVWARGSSEPHTRTMQRMCGESGNQNVISAVSIARVTTRASGSTARAGTGRSSVS
mmetsp:Transcript_10852/g.34578  ORF Transcript_10852/g.34578 Transcript_10852/m.34578 type:complete len:223 (+) Transcript_10852:545-1213(+)